MPKCPYCKSEVHIEDFFDDIAYKVGQTAVKRATFKGESIIYQNGIECGLVLIAILF